MLAYMIHLIISVLIIVIVIDALLSWAPRFRYRYREVTRIIETITDPILAPFRRLVPPMKTGGIDISPVLAIIALQIIDSIIQGLLLGSRS